MTHHTDAERAAYERELIDNHHYVPSDFSFKDGFYGGDDDYIQFGWDLWQAARRAPAEPVPQIDPVHGDCLPPIGSRVFIRHGRDDDAHACIVTGYYAWGDLKGSKHLHRVFVHLVYEGTDRKQARMLCDCYSTAEDALAAAPQPPEEAPHIGDCENKVCTGCMPSMPPVTPEEFSRDIAEMVAAPVKLPEPAITGSQGVCCGNFTTGGYYMGQHEQVCCGCPDDAHPPYYTEQQVRELLAAHGIQEQST